MKKLFLIILLLSGLVPALSAEKGASVTFRTGKLDDTVRLVFESDEEFLKKTAASNSTSAIRLDFPADFEFKPAKDAFFEAVKKDRSVHILLKEAVEVRMLRLTNPSRIVFDVKTARKNQSETNKTEAKRTEDTAPKETVQAEKAVREKLIVIDAGHGGYDFGLMSQEIKEKDAALALCRELGASLSKKGKTVFLTRRTDQFISITDRLQSAAGKTPAAFISIHASSTDGFVVNVASSADQNSDPVIKQYSHAYRQSAFTEKSRAFSKAVSQKLKRDLKTKVALRELPIPILMSVNAPAILIEVPMPGLGWADPKAKERFINAVIAGIDTNE